MSLGSKINWRRILVVFLVQVAVLLGLNFGIGYPNQALAQSVNAESVATPSGLLDEAEVEAAKEKRREAQAQRSEEAAKKRTRKYAKGDLKDKLNLDEPLPKSTQKFIKQIQGEEDINNQTHPQDN
ncbi:hypothetical protein [Gloeothece verrucosa]|uniref:Uncharacterized protein n=1 Tax=Gloeothece verrucosa (strain PCC 7822) TaxID=497965 RepID=E0UH91_GLOV7|nr:hypothetical protein [Gloeothece verrucosa]ADN16805.1 conserved hypothetical protein [Gloeothece verrucosa PCC 7822]